MSLEYKVALLSERTEILMNKVIISEAGGQGVGTPRDKKLFIFFRYASRQSFEPAYLCCLRAC